MKKILYQFACFLLLITVCLYSNAHYAYALTETQKKLFNKGIYYYDECGVGSSLVDGTESAPIEPVTAGKGQPDGAVFPALDPDSMAKAINGFIKKKNPNSKLKGFGKTIVAGAKHSDVSPFLIVSIAYKESSLSDPGDYNVKNGSNSFGRTAAPGQPSFQGARSWYKWSNVKASVDYTAAENRERKGGGDIAAYLRAQYGAKIDAGTITDLMNEYAPPFENDTTEYINNIKSWTNEMVQLTNEGGDGETLEEPTTPTTKPVGNNCGCSINNSSDPSAELTGADTREKIFTFLTGKSLSAEQAAGVIGNLAAESTAALDTSLIESGASSTMTAGVGYGLAQWTTQGRQEGLQKYADSVGKPISDLTVQVNYLWKELKDQPDFGLAELKRAKSVEEATRVFMNKYERPSIERFDVRLSEATKTFDQFKGSTPNSNAADSTTLSGNCSCEENTEPKTTGKTVAIDAGHGPSKTTIDDTTGLKQVETNNQPEGKNVWEIAQKVKSKLEKKGYKTVMVKQSENESVTFRERAQRADQANSDIAISIHTDTSLKNSGEIYPQKVGGYRGSGDGRVVFEDESVATASQKYSEAIKQAREKTEGPGIVIKDNSFGSREGYEPGDLQMVQLFSKTPWVYNEAKDSNKDKYADGLVNGIENALGEAEKDSETKGTEGPCPQQSGNGSMESIISTYSKWIWSDYSKPKTDARPAYKTAMEKASREGKYIGGGVTDCGGLVTRIMQISGADPNYNNKKEATPGQITQLQADSKYEKIGSVSSVSELKPGDIAVSNSHTYMYVGKNAGLKPAYDSVSASLGERTPMASNSYDLGSWSWFRLKNLNQDNGL